MTGIQEERPLRTLAILVGCAWAAVLPGLCHAAEPFRVCLLQHNPPLSDQESGNGFDVDVSKAVAERLGRPFEPVWIPNPVKMTEVDESDLPLEPLAQRACDAVPSVPGREVLGDLRDAVSLSRPYYGAGFELVAPGGGATLESLQGKRVSVQSVTVAHAFAEATGLRWTAQPTVAGQIASLDTHEADAALIWGPALWESRRKPAPGYTPPEILRWNSSFATRASDRDLAQAVDQALGSLREQGRIATLMKAHGIPEHAPFGTAFTPMAFLALQLGSRSGAATATPAAAELPDPNKPQDPNKLQDPNKSQDPNKTPDPNKQSDAPKTDPAATDGKGAGSPADAFRKDAKAVKHGEAIYTGTCGGYCHPANANAAGDAPYLFDCAWKHGSSDQAIANIIKNGVEGTRMVAFGEALAEEDIWKVIAYMRAASKCKK